MRRVFIVRKDLHLSHGKLAAQVGHCCEIYWINQIRNGSFCDDDTGKIFTSFQLEKAIYDDYVNGSIVKTVCECKNINKLLQARTFCTELGLIEGKDFGFVNDNCLTELTPENEDDTCTTMLWTKPLPDEIAHTLSRHYHLYVD